MKKVAGLALAVGAFLLAGTGQAWSLSPETAMLLDLLKAKGVINENEAAEFTKTLEAKSATAALAADDHYHSVQSLADRVERLEGKGSAGLAEVSKKIDLSGLVEVDLTTARQKDAEGTKSNYNDVVLSTAQLSADAEVNQYVSGHLALLYEEDPDNSSDNTITLDEALIGLKGGETMPVYANLGRMYVPFGHFESHFITDPTTLILGETNDTAVVAGYANAVVDLNAGFLRAKVKEMGQSDHINTAVASATFTLPKAEGEEGFAMTGGVSYISNLAASDGLVDNNAALYEDGDPDAHSGKVEDVAGGASAFLSLAYADRYFFDAEYLGALDSFVEGDFDFADPVVDSRRPRPQAWNFEAAARVVEKVELAVRYGGSDEAGTFLADDEYGAALLYNLFENTALTVEYLYQDFLDESNNSQATMQVAVEF